MIQNNGYLVLEENEALPASSPVAADTMTPQQCQVTVARDRDILVPAAAGSGKTWVLVQRILKRMEEEQIDIDRFLIVTFTKAAAAEMRERIGKAITQRIGQLEQRQQQGEDVAMQLAYFTRQETLVFQAQISTIDSFCGDIVHQYFMQLGIDPNYRVADEAELAVLKSEVIADVLEQAYAAHDADFIHFVECYAPGRDDKKLERMVQTLYQFQISHPDPDAWIADSLNRLADETGWFAILLDHSRLILRDVVAAMKEIIDALAGEPDAEKIRAVLESDLAYYEHLHTLCEDGDYAAVKQAIDANTYARFAKGKLDADMAEQIKDKRNALKAIVKDKLEKKYYSYSYDAISTDREAVIPDMRVLLLLSRQFRRAYERAKREQALADFSDVEHMALAILTTRDEDGRFVPSAVACKLKEQYAEIMIDEYQDSNYLQEAILSSIANHNMFMVGDMKQSIYRFRMARPELFVGKYKQFTSIEQMEGERLAKLQPVKIELNKNFRSSSNVLESINYIFYHIMQEEVGGVAYDEAASLKAGAAFLEPVLSSRHKAVSKTDLNGYCYDNDTEFLLYDAAAAVAEETEEEYTLLEQEAKMVAAKIQELMRKGQHMLVKDDSLPGELCERYRPLAYRDIVILLRSPSSGGPAFVKALEDAGIPVYMESGKGFFATPEIQTVVSYLKVLNNSNEDIALTAVLRNYFGGCSAATLAQLVVDVREQPCHFLFEKVVVWCELYEAGELPKGAERDSLYGRLNAFLDGYRRYQKMVQSYSVSEFLTCFYEDSGYLSYVLAMPNGQRRAANLQLLLQQARTYEKNHFRGLFQFVRYLTQLLEQEVDFGEASLLSESDDVVRIMSIHKSKGLEFPVVFVSTLAKRFNEMDLRDDVLLHADLGVGPNVIDPELRTKHKTIMKDMIALFARRDMLGEELRVLYVALTRAKDKCILSASVADWGKELSSVPAACNYSSISSARRFLDWILSALAHHRVLTPEFKRFGIEPPEYDEHRYPKAKFRFARYTPEQLDQLFVRTTLEREQAVAQLEREAKKLFAKTDMQKFKQQLSPSYPFDWAVGQSGKYSVSQLKEHHRHSTVLENGQPDVEETALERVWKPVPDPIVPRFMREEKQALSGAQKGTYIHKFMELYDFTKGYDMGEYNRVGDGMQERHMEGMRDILPADSVEQFFETALAQQMVQAAVDGQLYKEAQFVVGFPAEQVMRDMDIVGVAQGAEEQLILVQGIIDAYYVNAAGNLVIMDYKTDKVKSMEELRARYETQLKYYKKTLCQLTGKCVEATVIYSFALGQDAAI